VPWSGRGEALKGPRRTKSSEIDAKLTPNAHALVWGYNTPHYRFVHVFE